MDDVEVGFTNMSVERWRKRDLDEREWTGLVRDTIAKIKGVGC
jgi:hypothetical protein